MSIYRTGVAASWTSAHLGDPARDWHHVTGVIAMLDGLLAKVNRADAEPAVRDVTRRLIRDFSADHGNVALARMPDVDRYRATLTMMDRLFIFSCNDPKNLRMRLTWGLISATRALRRAATLR